jgi:uncharacterized protein
VPGDRQTGGVTGRRAVPVAVATAEAAGDEASLCVGCGLCCDGTLFDHLAVADESDLGMPLRLLGVEVIAAADPPVFALPCPAVADGVCTIYDRQRPRACAEFFCDLHGAVEAGRTSRAEAVATIRATQALRDRVRAGTADERELRAQVVAHFRADAG